MEAAKVSDSLDVMLAGDDVREQRVFEMLGERMEPQQIAAELGLSVKEAKPIIMKVLRERGTPQLVEIDRSIDRLAAIRF